ncbi:MAG: hypothetical protein PVI63_09065, partial [Anaerolineae bacterium]
TKPLGVGVRPSPGGRRLIDRLKWRSPRVAPNDIALLILGVPFGPLLHRFRPGPIRYIDPAAIQ